MEVGEGSKDGLVNYLILVVRLVGVCGGVGDIAFCDVCPHYGCEARDVEAPVAIEDNSGRGFAAEGDG